MPSFILAIFSAAVGWLIWRSMRNFLIRSPLDNIPGPEPPSYVKGNLGQLFNRNAWEFIDEIGTRYNKVVRLTGLFGHRMLYVFDPKALHQVVIKEAEAYELPEWSLESTKMTTGPGLLGVHGGAHRRQRKMLNPVFSIKHMREMTPLFYNIAHKLCNGIEAQIGNAPTTVNISDWFGRTALELIGQGGLGRSLDSLDKPEPNTFGDNLKALPLALFAMSEWQFLFHYVEKLGPASFRRMLADIVPMARLQKLKRLVTAIETESKHILAEKRDALKAGEDSIVRQVGEGKDLMSVLLRANMASSEQDRLTEEELIGQMSLLVLAGTDTTSNSLTQIMEILAQEPDIQDKLRAEILEAQSQLGDDIPYDELVALPYMDALCREALRRHPPATYVFREAQKDIVMPLSEPIVGVDGTTMNEIPVPAGTTVLIAIRAANLNKDIWGDDVNELKPERWLSPLPNSVTEAHIPGVYSNLMTFNGGGRACIGFKFSQLEMKIVLATMVSKFKISPAENAKDVVWNTSLVRYPSVGDDDKPEFPVKLERIKA